MRNRFGLPARLMMAALGACLVWGFAIEPRRLVTKKVALDVPDLPALRVGLLSDLHAGSRHINEAMVRRCVAALNDGKPDLILLLGDYMNNGRAENAARRPRHIDEIAGWLKELHAPLGVYAVLGNHDWWYDKVAVRAAFENAGIRVLDDQSAILETPAGPFALAGIADENTGRPKPARVVGAIAPELPVLAFTHSPDIFPDIPARVSLTLAGHTHGGQVRLPFIGAPILPTRHGSRYERGLVEENGHRMYITTGVGTSMIPVRFNVPPEIVFLDINKSESRH